MVTQHQFLSPEWIVAARALREEFSGRVTEPAEPVKANLVITDAPFGSDDIEGHVDTTSGTLMVDEGHLADPELTVTTDYETARALFVERDPAKAMEAFMMGKILVTGAVEKVMAFAAAPPPTEPDQLALAHEVAQRLTAITAS